MLAEGKLHRASEQTIHARSIFTAKLTLSWSKFEDQGTTGLGLLRTVSNVSPLRTGAPRDSSRAGTIWSVILLAFLSFGRAPGGIRG